MGYVVAVCTGRRATPKRCGEQGYLVRNRGLRGDYIGREVSLLAHEQIERANRLLALTAAPGSFGENLTVAGMDLHTLSTGDLLQIGDAAVLRVNRVGEPPGSFISYGYQGFSLLSVQGAFCEVHCEGLITTGDAIRVIESSCDTPPAD